MDPNAPMEDLLDFSRPFNVPLFEFTIRSFLDPNNPKHANAHGVIIALRESPHAWRCVDQILKESTNASVRVVALQILEQTITYRWKLLPQDQQLGIRNYLTDKLISLCSNAETMEQEKQFIQRLNLALIQVVKQEWPHNWPTLLQDLTSSARSSETLCENNMQLLQLLSEEVFEFSKEDMTQAKTKLLKETMNSQFEMVFQLCDMVLEYGTKPKLISTTLRTLLRFLNWIPIGFIFETPLIDRLLNRYLGVYQFRNDTLNCLSEIGSLVCDDQYTNKLVLLHNSVVTKLMSGMMPLSVNLKQEYERVKEEDREFIHHLAMFFSGFYSVHLPQLERSGPETVALLQRGMEYLLNISQVENPEVFKICLDAWTVLASDLYATECAPSNNHHLVLHQQQLFRGAAGAGDDDDDDDEDAERFKLPVSHAPRGSMGMPMSARKQIYLTVLSRLRYLMITRMTKPEEVLVKVESETGEVIREVTKDTDAIALYKQMRDTLVYLTHLDCDDTESLMLQRLAEQCGDSGGIENPSAYSSHDINTLSWAIGSISGTMDEQTEKQFLVAVIKDLLVLCEVKVGKDNKALIASDIMYVVGQYPRFLRNHWKFLKTVVAKLFEFMHELHPGVQDMACDTFMKLTLKCKRKFVQLQPGETLPFIDQLLQNLPNITSDLETHQVHSFYESVGHILACHPDSSERTRYLSLLMDLPNRRWGQLMQEASQSIESFQQEPAIREVIKIIRTNVAVAKSTNHSFVPQLAQIHSDMMNVYKSYATFISQTVQMQGPQAAQHSLLRTMRSAKIEILNLLKTFIERSEDPQMVAQRIVETLYVPILEDYSKSAPSARDSEVLDLFANIIHKLKGAMNAGVARILHYTFGPTVQMICTNFEDFPDIRQQFYLLLKHMNEFCFPALWNAPPESQKQIVETVIWGMKHTANDVQSMNLDFVEQLFKNIVNTASTNVAQQFYRDHLLALTNATVVCLTDRLHKSGFKMHSVLLKQVFVLVCDGHVQVSLASASQNIASPGGATGALVAASPSENVSVLSQFVFKLLSDSFPNSSQTAIRQFVSTLAENRNAPADVFKQNVRDFLITMKEFSGEDNKDLYKEETDAALEANRRAELAQRMQVGGLVNPHLDMNDL